MHLRKMFLLIVIGWLEGRISQDSSKKARFFFCRVGYLFVLPASVSVIKYDCLIPIFY